MAFSRPLNPLYIKALASELGLVEAVKQPKAFAEFCGVVPATSPFPAFEARRALLAHLKNLELVGYEGSPDSFCLRVFTRTWMTEFLREVDVCLEHGVGQVKAENAWQLAFIFCNPQRVLTNKRLFHNPVRAIKLISSVAPGLLWRIITLHDTPWAPEWVDEIRISMDYRSIMDAAETEDDKADVKRIKATLCDYFECNEELDEPEEEDCKWLGLKTRDGEDEDEEEEEDDSDIKCCCDGVPRAGCPVHGAKGNSRSFFQQYEKKAE
jgi:hypothetical protein